MNFRNLGIIIRREYLNKVKKKSFLIITILAPVLFAAVAVLPTLIMVNAKEAAKKIAVIDNSDIVWNKLENTETMEFFHIEDITLETAKTQIGGAYDAVVNISGLDSLKKSVNAAVYSVKPLGVDMSNNIERYIENAVEDYRINSYGIDGLKQILSDVKVNIDMTSYTLDEEGKESISESGVFMIVSMILGMILYMFIAIFGGMVMSSVIEEKSSRVIEVLISSVKATELMFGKIIGIALVAITQFLLWIVLTFSIIGVISAVVGKDLLGGQNPAEIAQMAGVDAQTAEAVTAAATQPGEADVIINTVKTLPIGEILICFLIFFTFGYMLYASLYAAIGSAVENEGDTQQLSLPITIPLLIAFFITMYVFKAPDSQIAFWGSMIPFTSPIVMIARLPFGVPAWEVILSMVILIATFFVMAWASAKIYKVGILMFGKKSTWKDLWKWLKQD